MKYSLLLIVFLFPFSLHAISAHALVQKGWEALVQDKDSIALGYFQQAHKQALIEKNTAEEALSLLNIAICYHGTSYTKGLAFGNQAMAVYQQLAGQKPDLALEGRSRCLQLISTIYGRQGKIKESIKLSKEALAGFRPESDTMGYIGLICSSLGTAYRKLNQMDSAEYYFQRSLAAQLRSRNVAYLPSSYLNVGDIALKKSNKTQSYSYFLRAQTIADSTGNKQAQVDALLAVGNWHLRFEENPSVAESFFQKARQIALELSDKSFYIRTLTALLSRRKAQGNFEQALDYQTEISHLKDSLNQWETQNIVKKLEVEFEVSEKDRQLALVQKEKDVALLTNYLLWGGIVVVLLIAGGIIHFLRKIHQREKALRETKEALFIAEEAQKRLKEIHLRNELEHRESQLSALTLQMIQKNALLQELNARLVEDNSRENHSLQKIIHKGLNQDKEWADFSTHFESINQNFYSRLKAAYPDISPNDVKICALIKMNLSIKEMATILNISPDSVKTARYRLRKKLQLNTEDNLTDFILSLE